MMRRTTIVTLISFVAIIPLFFGSQYVVHVAVTVCIMGILAMSLNLLLKIGQISFAQVVFMATGAYGSALLCMELGVPPAAAIFFASIASGVLATALGPLLLRTRGVYFVLLTFALAMIVNLILQSWVSLTGGNSGLFGIPRFSLLGFPLDQPRALYPFVLAIFMLIFFACVFIDRSRIGWVMKSLDDNEDLAISLGVSALAWKVAIFGISGVFAGLAGAIYAYFIGFLSPLAFTFHVSVDILVINVIGGIASPIGPLLGTVLLVPLPEILRDVQQYQLLAYGLLLIVFIAFFPKGIINIILDPTTRSSGALRALRESFKSK